jgi:hypothetical protein
LKNLQFLTKPAEPFNFGADIAPRFHRHPIVFLDGSLDLFLDVNHRPSAVPLEQCQGDFVGEYADACHCTRFLQGDVRTLVVRREPRCPKLNTLANKLWRGTRSIAGGVRAILLDAQCHIASAEWPRAKINYSSWTRKAPAIPDAVL